MPLIEEKLNAYPSQLSGGQQRRVAIARALIYDPPVILADEPTGDLDEETEADIMELFRRLNRERQITFIFITHNRITMECSNTIYGVTMEEEGVSKVVSVRL